MYPKGLRELDGLGRVRSSREIAGAHNHLRAKESHALKRTQEVPARVYPEERLSRRCKVQISQMDNAHII